VTEQKVVTKKVQNRYQNNNDEDVGPVPKIKCNTIKSIAQTANENLKVELNLVGAEDIIILPEVTITRSCSTRLIANAIERVDTIPCANCITQITSTNLHLASVRA
jgi:hypothetical protein